MTAASIRSITHPQTSGPAAAYRSDSPIRNKILKLLPRAELAAMVERSDVVAVKSREILFEPEEKLEHVYFPEDCVISLVTVMEEGDQVEAMTSATTDSRGFRFFTASRLRKTKSAARSPARRDD
jgi:hypothetical protein